MSVQGEKCDPGQKKKKKFRNYQESRLALSQSFGYADHTSLATAVLKWHAVQNSGAVYMLHSESQLKMHPVNPMVIGCISG